MTPFISTPTDTYFVPATISTPTDTYFVPAIKIAGTKCVSVGVLIHDSFYCGNKVLISTPTDTYFVPATGTRFIYKWNMIQLYVRHHSFTFMT